MGYGEFPLALVSKRSCLTSTEIPIIAAYTTLLLVLGAAWVGGYLDEYQHIAQDFALGKAGENRASYGIKSETPSESTLSEQILTHP